MDVVEGQVLAGKYRIERVLGRGGMGLVVAATHLQLGERVALKFLLADALQNPEAVARFDREARAAVRIKSEHIARVSDVGTLENGAPYLVMEYLDGLDLSAWLAQRGPLPVEQAVDFVLQACDAIAEAHTLGIVHRDLKPANLFVIERPDGALAVKVLDFGISKMAGLSSSGAAMTKTTAVLGSPFYMSPEQMQSAKDVDPRGDIWALGVVLYELLSGRTPFSGETMAELVLKVVTAAPIPLRATGNQVPPGLEAVVFKCLEKERGARYATVAELALALFAFAPRRSKLYVERIGRVMQRAGYSPTMTQLPPSSVPALTPALAPEPIPPPRTMASWAQTTPPPNHRRRAVLIAAALVVVATCTLSAIALSRRSGYGAPALASGALPLGVDSPTRPAAPLPQAAKVALEVEPPATSVLEASSAQLRPLPATSVAQQSRPAATPGTSTGRSTLSPAPSAHSRAPDARGSPAPMPIAAAVPATEAPPPHTAAASKPVTPPAVKNPLKMSIQ